MVQVTSNGEAINALVCVRWGVVVSDRFVYREFVRIMLLNPTGGQPSDDTSIAGMCVCEYGCTTKALITEQYNFHRYPQYRFQVRRTRYIYVLGQVTYDYFCWLYYHYNTHTPQEPPPTCAVCRTLVNNKCKRRRNLPCTVNGKAGRCRGGVCYEVRLT